MNKIADDLLARRLDVYIFLRRSEQVTLQHWDLVIVDVKLLFSSVRSVFAKIQRELLYGQNRFLHAYSSTLRNSILVYVCNIA